jgi:hypothetical protein
MADKAEEIEELIKANKKLIEEGEKLAQRQRELVDELKKNIAKFEGKIKKKSH